MREKQKERGRASTITTTIPKLSHCVWCYDFVREANSINSKIISKCRKGYPRSMLGKCPDWGPVFREYQKSVWASPKKVYFLCVCFCLWVSECLLFFGVVSSWVLKCAEFVFLVLGPPRMKIGVSKMVSKKNGFTKRVSKEYQKSIKKTYRNGVVGYQNGVLVIRKQKTKYQTWCRETSVSKIWCQKCIASNTKHDTGAAHTIFGVSFWTL